MQQNIKSRATVKQCLLPNYDHIETWNNAHSARADDYADDEAACERPLQRFTIVRRIIRVVLQIRYLCSIVNCNQMPFELGSRRSLLLCYTHAELTAETNTRGLGPVNCINKFNIVNETRRPLVLTITLLFCIWNSQCEWRLGSAHNVS
jgi:hypothetical protein